MVTKKRKSPSSSPLKSFGINCDSYRKPGDVSSDDMGLDGVKLPGMLPVSMPEFFKEYFRRKALYVSGDGGTSSEHRTIAEALQGPDVDYIFNNTSSDSVFVWIKNGGGGKKGGRKLKSVAVEPSTAATLHGDGGHATYCRAPSDVEQVLVSNFISDLGLCAGRYDTERSGLDGRGEVEVFCGTKGHYTDWHYDFQENFTFQLTGCKRWRLCQSAVKSPIRGVTPHYMEGSVVEGQVRMAKLATPDFKFEPPFDAEGNKTATATSDYTTIDMKAGDFMYFPAGMWHSVETIEPGVSINVSLMGTTYAEVYCQALQHALLKDDGWRSVVNVGADGPDRLGELMKTKLFDVARQLTAGCILPPAQLENKVPKFGVEGGEDSDEDDESGSDDEEDEGVIHLDREFSHPDAPGMNTAFTGDGTSEFRLNPLCVLVKGDELNYYAELDGKKRKKDDGVVAYVANINFAGGSSEAMLSAERHVLMARNKSPEFSLMERLLVSGESVKDSKSVRNLLQWLFYCGVIVK